MKKDFSIHPQQSNSDQKNECPKKDPDGNCIVPGTYSDSEPIGGG